MLFRFEGRPEADAEVSLSRLLAELVSGDRKFDPRTLPREVWLAGTSICVGLLSGFLWWAGARSRGPAGPEAFGQHWASRPDGPHPHRGHPQIDWSRAEAGRHDDAIDPPDAADRRAAA